MAHDCDTCGGPFVCAAGLGEDEIRVVEYLLARLRRGRELHGQLDFTNDRRDWRKEIHEELGDYLWYDVFALLAKEMKP